MTGYQSKKKAASAKTIDQVNWADHEPDGLVHTAQEHAEQLAKLGWQYFECPACGSEGAQAFLKPVAQPAQPHCQCSACKDGKLHLSDCVVHNEPAYPAGPCDCGVLNQQIAQPAQEPVGKFAKFTDGVWREVTNGSAGIPLYTTPPQRTWVGLTKDEKETLSYKAEGNTWTAVELAEAKLKEKNNGT